MKKTAIYGRTSTSTQETGLEAQMMACRKWCESNSIDDIAEFSDDGISGKEEHRPALDELFERARAGEFERVVVYSLSRLSRDWIHSWRFVLELKELGAQFVSCTETIEVDTPEGKLFFKIMSAMNEYFREDTVRKVKNGLANARAKGVRLGPPVKRDDRPILMLVDRGLSVSEVSRQLGVSRGAVYRAIRARGNS